MRARKRVPRKTIIYGLAALMLASGTLIAQNGPPTPQDFLKQGNEFSKAQNWKEAVAAYRKALSLKPDYLEAHYGLAIAYGATEKVTDAIREYREVLKL